jgi:hypothetical protein
MTWQSARGARIRQPCKSTAQHVQCIARHGCAYRRATAWKHAHCTPWHLHDGKAGSWALSTVAPWLTSSREIVDTATRSRPAGLPMRAWHFVEQAASVIPGIVRSCLRLLAWNHRPLCRLRHGGSMSGSGPERWMRQPRACAAAPPLERAGDGGVPSGLRGYELLPSPDILVAKLLARGVLFSPDRLLRRNWVQPVRCGGLFVGDARTGVRQSAFRRVGPSGRGL